MADAEQLTNDLKRFRLELADLQPAPEAIEAEALPPVAYLTDEEIGQVIRDWLALVEEAEGFYLPRTWDERSFALTVSLLHEASRRLRDDE